MSDDSAPSTFAGRRVDFRRWLTLFLSVGLIAAAIAVRTWGQTSSSLFVSAACFRIGLVFAAIWLAWDSLRRPARWFPPAILAAGVAGLAIVAAQPRLILVLAPTFGLILTLGAVIRAFRRRS